MKILLLGRGGQVGWELQRSLSLLGEVIAVDFDAADNPEGLCGDFTDLAGLAATVRHVQPHIIVNAAAHTAVDKAEGEPEVARLINALAPATHAQAATESGAWLVHFSTDYVFGHDAARRMPLSETDPTGPVSVYGASKLAGELAVRSRCPQHFLVRTCGLYGQRAARGKGNFVETMLRLGRECPELKIVADQRCTPTSTADLAAALVSLIETDTFGTYHATNDGDCSWFEFAREIFRLTDLTVNVIPNTAIEYGAKARRPDYSVLDSTKLASVLGRPMPSWRDALSRYLALRAQ